MSFFGKILNKFGMGDDKAEPKAEVAATPTPEVEVTVADAAEFTTEGPGVVAPEADVAATPQQQAPVAETVPDVIVVPEAQPTVEMNSIDVVSMLEDMAANNSQKLNWKTSIVDLLKLLDLDSSFGARKELAKELSCPADKMADSAQMNMWLHKTVLTRLAENGGNIPADLIA